MTNFVKCEKVSCRKIFSSIRREGRKVSFLNKLKNLLSSFLIFGMISLSLVVCLSVLSVVKLPPCSLSPLNAGLLGLPGTLNTLNTFPQSTQRTWQCLLKALSQDTCITLHLSPLPILVLFSNHTFLRKIATCLLSQILLTFP